MRVTRLRLLGAAAFLTVMLSVVTLLPFEYHVTQLFTHFRMQYLVASSALLLIFAALREARYTLILLLTTILNGYYVLPWYLDDPPGVGGAEIELILANVLSSNDDHERLLELVEAEQPDLIFLLEISPAWAKSLQRLDAAYPHSIVEPRNGNFGIAMYSRLPLISAASVESAPLGFPTIVAAVDVDGRSVTMIGTHAMMPLGNDNYRARNTQLNGIARLLQRSAGPRLLVGDLNTSVWESHYGALENKTWLRNARRGFGAIPTWPTFMPPAMIPIDHVLVSDDFGVRDIRTGPRIGSDHLPLIVALSLKRNRPAGE